jgi:hypothetical protein
MRSVVASIRDKTGSPKRESAEDAEFAALLEQAGKEIDRIAQVLRGMGQHMIEVDAKIVTLEKIADARNPKKPTRRRTNTP